MILLTEKNAEHTGQQEVPGQLQKSEKDGFGKWQWGLQGHDNTQAEIDNNLGLCNA